MALTRLSEHFTLSEFIESSTAKKRNIDNTPNSEIVGNIQELVNVILEPLRAAWGSGIKVNSGYRCPALNKAVGGSSTSAHTTGWAADIKPANGKIAEFKSFVIKWLKNNNMAFDQYINEFSGNSQWVHIALYNRNKQQRKQYLKYKNGIYTRI